MPNKKPYQKKKKPITFPGFYPSWVYGPNEAITPREYEAIRPGTSRVLRDYRRALRGRVVRSPV